MNMPSPDKPKSVDTKSTNENREPTREELDKATLISNELYNLIYKIAPYAEETDNSNEKIVKSDEYTIILTNPYNELARSIKIKKAGSNDSMTIHFDMKGILKVYLNNELIGSHQKQFNECGTDGKEEIIPERSIKLTKILPKLEKIYDILLKFNQDAEKKRKDSDQQKTDQDKKKLKEF